MIDPHMLELFLENDEDIKILEKMDDGHFKIEVEVPDSEYASDAVTMIATMKISPLFIMFVSRVDDDHLGYALAACEQSNVTGIMSFGNGFAMRSSILSQLSEPVAINNIAKAHAMAALQYRSLVSSN